MAAPGIGVGDIVLLCQTIAKYARWYKDAPEDFDEIAVKASSTAVLLARIDREVQKDGNIVLREGPEAFDQLQDNLANLRKDSKRLESLVQRYNKIHDEGYGRRVMWAFKESGNIDELRRQIGLHEQSLQLWYMTLMTGSLRRLEIGQADIMKDQAARMKEILRAIEFTKTLSPSERLRMKNSIVRGDSTLLVDVLKKNRIGTPASPQFTPESTPLAYAGVGSSANRPPRMSSHRPSDMYTKYNHQARPTVSTRPTAEVRFDEDALKLKTSDEAVFNETLQAVSEYILADPVEKMELESKIRTASTIGSRPLSSGLPEDQFEYITGSSGHPTKTQSPNIFSELHRSKSTGDERKRPTYESRYYRDPPNKTPKSTGFTNLLSVPGESYRPRRLSDDLVIKSHSKQSNQPIGRSNSHGRPHIMFANTEDDYERRETPPTRIFYDHDGPTPMQRRPPQEPVEEIIASRPPPRPRSHSRSRPTPPPERHRSSSRHSARSDGDRSDTSRTSYIRERSSSRGEGGRLEKVYVIKKMDRIDSLDVRD